MIFSIEDEFQQSWDAVQTYYRQDYFLRPEMDWMHSIQTLISELRRRNYDTKIRAGHAMWELVLSRSQQHGLRPQQHYIRIAIQDDSRMKLTYWAGRIAEIVEIEAIAFTPELERMIARLLEQNID